MITPMVVRLVRSVRPRGMVFRTEVTLQARCWAATLRREDNISAARRGTGGQS
jgi:hypothetical protein